MTPSTSREAPKQEKGTSREAAAQESPARKCRENVGEDASPVGTAPADARARKSRPYRTPVLSIRAPRTYVRGFPGPPLRG